MNYELFLAKRIISSKEYKNSISSPIIKIAIMAISLGMIVMLIAIATGDGLREKIRSKISGFKGHVQITNYDANNSDGSVIPIDKNQKFYPRFSNIEGIKNVQVYANQVGLIRTKTDFEGIIFKGVSSDYDWTFFKEYLISGSLPNFNQKRTRDILLSSTVVNRLKLKLNDTINATFFKNNTNKLPSNRKLVIVGVYDTGFLEFDKNMMIGDIRQVQRLNKWKSNEVGGFEIILENFDDLSLKGNEIYREIDSTLDATTIAAKYPALFEWIELFDNNTWFIIVIMILVAGINMITALLVLILERIPMVGVLKSLGSSNWSIRKIFLYNASYLIFIGLFWGNLAGLTFLFIQKYGGFITLDPATYYVSEVPVSINLLSIVLLNIGTLIVCFVMLIIPSIIITKIEPSKSIKFA
ncbi:FtsX-like permease family protein [Flavobacteriaceae bacterium]|nr:FtsX-like permease family protein [Flavobacteriaceae bacterium]MDB4256742.1 FtsX-like permease family protein [Flavobacteriaceae bacterium]